MGTGKGSGNIIPWRPGQSGNPRGGSRKLTLRMRLRKALGAKLPAEVADRLIEALGPDFDLDSYGDAIIARLVTLALDPKPGLSLEAARAIIGLEGDPVEGAASSHLPAAPFPDPFPDLPETVPDGETLQ